MTTLKTMKINILYRNNLRNTERWFVNRLSTSQHKNNYIEYGKQIDNMFQAQMLKASEGKPSYKKMRTNATL